MMSSSLAEPDPPSKASEQNHSASPAPGVANTPPPPSTAPETNARDNNAEAHPQPTPPATAHYSGHHPPPPHYPQHPPHPHSMGYPPVMGYPHGHPPPPSYNNSYATNPYHNYPGAPPMGSQGSHPGHAGYYPNPNYMHPHMQPDHAAGMICSNFVRGFVLTIIVLFIISIISSIVQLFENNSLKEPLFFLASFTVTNLNVTNSVLTGSCDADVIVEDREVHWKTIFDRFESYVYHQNSEEVLAWSAHPPVNLEKNANTTLALKNSMVDTLLPKQSVLDAIDKEKQAGAVNFVMMMKILLEYQADNSLPRLQTLRVVCEDIKVGFLAGATNGTLAIDQPRACAVYK